MHEHFIKAYFNNYSYYLAPMASIVINKQDTTTSILKISIFKDDYLPKFEKELKNYRKRAQLKGFRPGTAPMSVVKKMYGKSLLYETIMEVVNTELYQGISDQSLNVLAQPELVEDGTDKLDLNLDTPVEEYTMSFKVGHYHLDLKGVDKSQSLTRYRLADMSKRAEDELDRISRRAIRPEETTEKIIENDIFYISAKECNIDGTIKEDGYETTISVFSKGMKLKQEAKDLFFGKIAAGDQVQFNARDLETWQDEKSEEDVTKSYRRYILNLPEGDERQVGDHFIGTINSVMRTSDPILNDDFFADNFPPQVTNKEEALAYVAEQLVIDFDEAFRSTLRRQAKLAVLEANKMDLPTEMLSRWFRKNDPRLTVENMENNLEPLLNQVRLQIITDRLVADGEIGEAENHELRNYFGQVVSEQYGQYIPEQYLDPIINNMMKREEDVSEARFTLKHRGAMDYAIDHMTINDESVTEDELKVLMDAELERERALFGVKY
jgi:trigger factor